MAKAKGNSDADQLDQLQVQLDQLESAADKLTEKRCPFHHQSSPVTQCESSLSNPISYAGGVSFVPDYSIPVLAPGGGNTDPNILEKLGPLAGFVGTWVSDRYSGYNVMPIPEATAPNGFILKNFYYYEVITFSAISGKVANRGGAEEQDSYTLFYEQRVFFADGQQADQLVHAENGSLLHLVTGPQGQGILNAEPYVPSPPAPNPIPPQNPDISVVKQISVPHGNSILALGGFSQIDGAPTIPKANALPVDAPDCFNAPYGSSISSNPNINPNVVLQNALDNVDVCNPIVGTYLIDLKSNNNGSVVNIPFIREHADVSEYSNTFWLEEFLDGTLQLQYTQNITLKFPNSDQTGSYLFPHITANTLRKAQ